MIILISGGIGSGKSLSAVKMILKNTNIVYSNFKLKGVKNHIRLKWEHMIKQVVDDKRTNPKTTYYKDEINWDYWKQTEGCNIYLDEMHNIVDSRSSMNKKSILLTQWLSQIRKIHGQEGDQNDLNFLKRVNGNIFRLCVDDIINKSNNIICITQRVGKIDVRFREMSHIYIQCQKIKIAGEIFIIQNYYFGDDNISAIDSYEMGHRPKKAIFHAPKYYKYYDSYELISTGGEYL